MMVFAMKASHSINTISYICVEDDIAFCHAIKAMKHCLPWRKITQCQMNCFLEWNKQIHYNHIIYIVNFMLDNIIRYLGKWRETNYKMWYRIYLYHYFFRFNKPPRHMRGMRRIRKIQNFHSKNNLPIQHSNFHSKIISCVSRQKSVKSFPQRIINSSKHNDW